MVLSGMMAAGVAAVVVVLMVAGGLEVSDS